jgi:hypothetical protein
MVGGELALAVGHEGHLMRPHGAHEVHQVVEGVALDVVLGLRPVLQQRGEVVHVVRADVALVGPRVHGDAVGAGLQASVARAHDARDAQVARVAQQATLLTLTDSAVTPPVGAAWASSVTRGFIGRVLGVDELAHVLHHLAGAQRREPR